MVQDTNESGARLSGVIEVDVVRANAATFPHLTDLRPLLSRDEAARYEAFKVREAATTFLLARALLRRELSDRLRIEPAAVAFSLRGSGKPDLTRPSADSPDWRFSVSHTGPHVAIAFALGADVGLDIERVDRLTNPLDIASRYFTAREQRGLRAATTDAVPRAFFAGWTRKEAIVKARGSTMSESLDSVSVDLDPAAGHPSYEDARDRPVCRLTSFEWPADRLIGAVAVIGSSHPVLRVTVCDAVRMD